MVDCFNTRAAVDSSSCLLHFATKLLQLVQSNINNKYVSRLPKEIIKQKKQKKLSLIDVDLSVVLSCVCFYSCAMLER